MKGSTFSQRHSELNKNVIQTIAIATTVLLLFTLAVVAWRYFNNGQAVYHFRLWWNVLMLIISIGAVLLATRGQWLAASYLYIIGESLLLFGYPVFLQIGVHAIGLYALPVIILLSAFLFHPRLAWVSALGFSFCFALVLAAESSGWITVNPANYPDSVLITVAVIAVYVLVGWLSYRYSSLYRRNFDELLLEQHALLQALQAIRLREKKLLEMQTALIQADSVKSQFLSMMSHELRTPLNGILGAAQLLEEEGQLQRDEYVSVIQQSSKNLAELIENVLQYSQLELDVSEVQEVQFSPVQLLQKIAAHFAEVATKKGLQIQIELGCANDKWIVADERRIRMVLHQLVSNAIKFTEHGRLAIRCSHHEHKNTWEFTVSDTGIGLSEEQIKNIFEPFKQGESGTNRRFGGIGLGLTLAHLNLKLLGSQLEIESHVGEGSRFRFFIETAAT